MEVLLLVWQSTIQCNLLNQMYQQFVSVWLLLWVHFLLSAGAKGKRFALPNAEVMIHQPLGGAQGQATEIEIHAKHILQTT